MDPNACVGSRGQGRCTEGRARAWVLARSRQGENLWLNLWLVPGFGARLPAWMGMRVVMEIGGRV
eukprot:5157688-Pleurochrysis_carterae.AAC.1